jgi:O-antigen/teichoic acid export membrane protein
VAVLRPLGVLHRTIDRVVVGSVLGPSAVALVEIATQMMNGADAILSAMSYAVLPSAAWLRARGDRATLEVAQRECP